MGSPTPSSSKKISDIVCVVVLAGVNEDVLELISPPLQRADDRRDLHEVGPRADHGEDLPPDTHRDSDHREAPTLRKSAISSLTSDALRLNPLSPMKQVVLRNGHPLAAEVPAPSPQPGHVLVANAASVISSGTERVAISPGGGSLPMRAVRNPDLVLLTLRHAREHGVRETVGLVRSAVSDDVVIGYASAGTVLDTGGLADFSVGQAVACAGARRANHAEVVSVPGNLVAAVPQGVSLRDAAFTTLGAIAMQGVRRAEVSLGERIVVVGLGQLGLLTVQILRAAGCVVLGVEPDASRRELALQLGAEQAIAPDGADARRARVGRRRRSRRGDRDRCGRVERDRQRRGGDGPPQGPRRAGRRRRPDACARPALRARGRRADLDLIRAGTLRPALRGGGDRLPARIRALDRESQHGRVSAAARRAAASRSSL